MESAEELTLDGLAEQIRAQPVPDRTPVCYIEQLEHIFQRSVGGTELGARILGFLSETDTRVLWIATMTDAAWQFVQASEPAAARLVTRHSLDPLDRAELEELIMTRHRRSGLRLRVEVPDESAPPILTCRRIDRGARGAPRQEPFSTRNAGQRTRDRACRACGGAGSLSVCLCGSRNSVSNSAAPHSSRHPIPFAVATSRIEAPFV